MKQQQFNFSLFQVAEIELSYQSKRDAAKRPVICSSSAAYDLLSNIWGDTAKQNEEQFHVLLLNRANKVLGIFELPIEDILQPVRLSKKILTTCLKTNAVAMIIGHYRPNNLERSTIKDEKIIKDVKCAGSLLDINVLDCVISSGCHYISLADQGLL